MNWIKTKEKSVLSTFDKIKDLLKQASKLVSIERQELSRLRYKKLKIEDMQYVDNLYQHYIIYEYIYYITVVRGETRAGMTVENHYYVIFFSTLPCIPISPLAEINSFS